MKNKSKLFILNTSISYISNKDFKTIKKFLDLGYNYLFSDSKDLGQGLIELISINPIISEYLNINNLHYIPNKSQPNIHELELILKKYKIAIIPADKNLGFVILDNYIYKQAINNLLRDKKTYRIIHKDDLDLFNSEAVKDCWHNLKILKKFHFVNLDQFYLLDSAIDNTKAKIRTIYGLPKVHKEPNSWAIPFLIPKIRPIIAGVNCHTYFFEKVLTSILQPIVDNLKYVIHSSVEIKEYLHNIVNIEKYVLFTLDVESLYPSIPISEGITIVSESIEQWYNKKQHQLVIKSMINLLEILLRNNTLIFDNKHYIQICGTAMGMAFAPAYANIFMDRIDQIANKHPLAPILYVRYLDDILGVYQHTEIQFCEYFQALNNINPAIKFTVEKLLKKVNYLDLTIDISNSIPKFTLYQKNTIINNLVDFSSNHSINILLATIQGFLFKIYNYNNDILDINNQLISLAEKLKDKNYHDSILPNQLKIVQDRLFINDQNRTIIGKICCNTSFCKYCLSISKNKISHCKLNQNILINQNYNCEISNFTFIAQCTHCEIKIISHYHHKFRNFIANSIKNINQNIDFHLLTKHLRSHQTNSHINLNNYYLNFEFHIMKHFSKKDKPDFTFFNKLKINNVNCPNTLWNVIKTNMFEKSHYITHSPQMEHIILMLKRKFKIKNINTYTNYKNQLKNMLTQKLKKF